MTPPLRPRNSCPRCGEALLRVRRRPEDRALKLMVPTRRYSCTAGDCDWQGLVPISFDLYGRRRSATVSPWRPRPWMFGLVLFVAAAVGARTGWQHLQRAAQRVPGLAAGESHDGVPLPNSHPLRRQHQAAAAAAVAARAASAASAAVQTAQAAQTAPAAASAASATTVAAPASAAVQSSRAPAHTATIAAPRLHSLELRQGCAWGQPGRSPYRGTVEEALLAARVPEEVVRQIALRVRNRDASDRLNISSASIRGVAHGREFEPRSMAMSFGRTLCLQTRVNFVAGHVEQADLYEAADRHGRKYAVMVPDVCGNVSVLGARGEREDPLLRGAQARAGASAAGSGDDPAVNEVPEPGSLASALVALLGLVLAWCWRRRRD